MADARTGSIATGVYSQQTGIVSPCNLALPGAKPQQHEVQMLKEATTGAPVRKLVSMAAVCELASVSRGTIYNWVNDGAFPAPVQLGKRRIAFREADILDWMDRRQSVAWAA